MDSGEKNYRRFLSGDKEGLVEIIRIYKDGLILYINSIVKNLHTAEELTEDTFVKLYVKKPKYSGKSTFKTWLYAIGRHTAADYVRKHSKLHETPTDEVYELSDMENIERNYIKSEERIALHKSIQRLKPEYGQILSLIFIENFNNAEAAEIIGKSVKQTSELLYRAKIALKKELEKEGFVYEGL